MLTLIITIIIIPVPLLYLCGQKIGVPSDLLMSGFICPMETDYKYNNREL